MGKLFVYHQTVFVPQGWDDGVWQRAVAYWQERGFHFGERHGETQSGSRGSLWGNWFLLDARTLRTTLTLSRVDLTHVEFTLTVETSMGQVITEWNEAYWCRELSSLEKWLLEGDTQEDEWRSFNRLCHRAHWGFGISLGPGGNKIPPEWR
jgi:hypothetical protein